MGMLIAALRKELVTTGYALVANDWYYPGKEPKSRAEGRHPTQK